MARETVMGIEAVSRLSVLFFAVSLFGMSYPATASQTETQTIHLDPGWNSVFMEVQPEPSAPASVFSGIPVESVWAYLERNSTVEFIQNPSEGLWNQPGWVAYFADPEEAFLTSLYGISANQAYLVKLGGTSSVDLSVTGRPSHRKMKWSTNSFNLTGFHVSKASPPSFGSYFGASTAHKNQAVYRLGSGGAWEFVNSPSSTQMKSGEAYWVYCNGASGYQGPMDVDMEYGDSLDFGANIIQRTIRIKNLSSVTKTVSITLHSSANPVVLSYKKLDTATSSFVWDDFSAMPAMNIEAGKQKTVQVAVRRESMSYSPAESVMEISDTDGGSILIPVSAE